MADRAILRKVFYVDSSGAVFGSLTSVERAAETPSQISSCCSADGGRSESLSCICGFSAAFSSKSSLCKAVYFFLQTAL